MKMTPGRRLIGKQPGLIAAAQLVTMIGLCCKRWNRRSSSSGENNDDSRVFRGALEYPEHHRRRGLGMMLETWDANDPTSGVPHATMGLFSA